MNICAGCQPEVSRLLAAGEIMHQEDVELAIKQRDEAYRKFDVANLQVSEYRKMLEAIEDFGLNAGNWTGDKESSAWNMTPEEDRKLDSLWDCVRILLSKSEKPLCDHAYSKLFGKMVCEKCDKEQEPRSAYTPNLDYPGKPVTEKPKENS